MPKHKNALLVNLEYYPTLALISVIRLMPLSVAYWLATMFGKLIYYVDFKHRKRTIQHLSHAGVAKDLRAARALAKANFIHLAKVGVELFKVDQLISPENFRSNVKLVLAGDSEKAIMDPRGLIMVGAHYGNWEISGLGYSIMFRPILSVMRPFDNPKIGAYIQSKRARFRQTMVDKKEAIKPIIATLRKGKTVGLLCDQHANRHEGVETMFFGHPARTHTSAAMLHLKTGAPILLGFARRMNDNFHFEFKAIGPFEIKPTGDMSADIKTLTQMFTTALEKEIAEVPEQWLWSHRRWLDINRKK